MKGLYNYFTAANIRDKVKHPLFLSIFFSNCVKLYFNPKFIDNSNPENLIKSMQQIFYEFYIKGKLDCSNKEKVLILCFKNIFSEKSIKVNKIIESFDSCKSLIFDICLDEKNIPA